MLINLVALAAAVGILGWLAIKMFRMVCRSRHLTNQYRNSSEAERRELERRWKTEPEIQSQMRPLRWIEVLAALAAVAVLIVGKALGVI